MNGELGSHTLMTILNFIEGSGLQSEDMFIIWQMGVHEVPSSMDDPFLKSYNNMHADTVCKWKEV